MTELPSMIMGSLDGDRPLDQRRPGERLRACGGRRTPKTPVTHAFARIWWNTSEP